ncbi:hypothetical protein [Brachyspira hyodysenteriae]|nr:hypothetical protein [Brachyspira hyodysenteriae]
MGYYVEVTKSNVSSKPGDFIKRQTLIESKR